MTNQEAFDKMMSHLRSLSGQSRNEYGCVYNGSKCAIGALMTDEEQEVYGDFGDEVLVLLEVILDSGGDSFLLGLDVPFLSCMQDLHDATYNWSSEGFEGEDIAEDIAKDYGLIYTKP